MRYYEIKPPDEEKFFVTNARSLKNLPPGTRCTIIVTEANGTPVEHIDIPVLDGRVKFSDSKRKPVLVARARVDNSL